MTDQVPIAHFNCSCFLSLEIIKLLKIALEILIGDGEDDSVDSCTGGLLGKEVFGKNIFTYKIPVVGLSPCDFASSLQVIATAVDLMVNECSECNDDNSPKSPFSVIETQLTTLLQDGVGGSPSVTFSSADNDIRSALEIDIVLSWRYV